MGTITVTNLGKAYKQYPNRWSRLLEWLLPFSKTRHQLKWILQDINFKVNSGEAIGIIGINGAGKSTLLKMITGTTQPSTGSVNVTGRVAALLELGMGFHPDFTGRQNAIMAGQLLGMGVEEIEKLMPEIAAFAEIGNYLNQPVRVYSSGMQMRLAFSVATARRPDILIVDEALSVGDAYFQHKSFERIREFRKQGTTLMIVSHDKQAIQSICDRAILLNARHIVMESAPAAVMDYYAALLAERHKGYSVAQHVINDKIMQTVSGTGEAKVTDISLIDSSGNKTEYFEVGEQVSLEIEVTTYAEIARLVLGFLIRDRFGNPVYGTNTHHTNNTLINIVAGKRFRFNFSFQMNVGMGTYSISTSLVSSDTRYLNNYECNDVAMFFQVINTIHPQFSGIAWLNAAVEIEKK